MTYKDTMKRFLIGGAVLLFFASIASLLVGKALEVSIVAMPWLVHAIGLIGIAILAGLAKWSKLDEMIKNDLFNFLLLLGTVVGLGSLVGATIPETQSVLFNFGAEWSGWVFAGVYLFIADIVSAKIIK